MSPLTRLLNRSVPDQLPLEIPLEIPLRSDEAGHPSLPTRSGFSEFSNIALLKLEQKVFAFPDAVLLTSCGKVLRTEEGRLPQSAKCKEDTGLLLGQM